MASPATYDGLKNFLLAQFPIVIDFDTLDPALEQGTAQFLAIEELFGTENPISFGDPSIICTEEVAYMLVHCFVPAPESSAVARALAQSVLEYLRGQTINDIIVNEVSPPELEEMNNGLWTAANVEVITRRLFHVLNP